MDFKPLKAPSKAHKSKLSIDKKPPVIQLSTVTSQSSSISDEGGPSEGQAKRFPRVFSDETLNKSSAYSNNFISTNSSSNAAATNNNTSGSLSPLRSHIRSVSEDTGRAASKSSSNIVTNSSHSHSSSSSVASGSASPLSFLYTRTAMTSFITPSPESPSSSHIPKARQSSLTRRIDRHVSLFDDNTSVHHRPHHQNTRDSPPNSASHGRHRSEDVRKSKNATIMSNAAKTSKFSFFSADSSASTHTLMSSASSSATSSALDHKNTGKPLPGPPLPSKDEFMADDEVPKSAKIKDIFMSHYRPFSEVVGEITSSGPSTFPASLSSSSRLKSAGQFDSVESLESPDSVLSINTTTTTGNQNVSDNAKTLHVLLNSMESSGSITSPDPKSSLMPPQQQQQQRRRGSSTDKKGAASNNSHTNHRLFDFFTTVHLESGKPAIKMRYPAEDSPQHCSPEIIRNLALFCFPEVGPDLKISQEITGETFSFVISGGSVNDGKKHAYCKRIVDKKKKPLVLCILSSVASSSIYYDVLSLFEKSIHDQATTFNILDKLWVSKCPRPGKSIRLTVTMNGSPADVTLDRQMESTAIDEQGLLKIFQCLGILGLKSLTQTNIHFLKLSTLLSAMLMEKQIMFVSKSLQKLSDCCNGANSLIYPLEWQHIFIPILPTSLLEIVCSPTPYIVGVLNSDMNTIVPGYSSTVDADSLRPLDGFDRDQCLVVNLDSGKLTYSDSLGCDKFIPTFLQSKLKQSLEEAYSKQRPAISEALISFFLLIFGNYRDSIEVEIKKLKPKNVNSKNYDTVITKNEVSWIQRAGSPQPNPKIDIITNEASKMKHSRSEELLSMTDEIQVWFDFDSFVNNHPLVTGRLDNLKTIGRHMRILSLQQRQSMNDFLGVLRNSHNFAFFVQQREDAFQFHYQMQLDRDKGDLPSPTAGFGDLKNNLGGAGSIKKGYKGGVSSAVGAKGGETDAGLKQYYTLAQSVFERKVTQIEVMATSVQSKLKDLNL